jgi:hypothetical protein
VNVVTAKTGSKIVDLNETMPLVIKGKVRIHDDGLADFLVCEIKAESKKIKSTYSGSSLSQTSINLNESISLKTLNARGKAVVNVLGRHKATLSGSLSLSMRWEMTDLNALPATINVTSVRLGGRQRAKGLPKFVRAKIGISQSRPNGVFEILRYSNFDCK